MPQLEGFADLILATLKDLGPQKWSELAFPLQAYPGFTQLLKEERTTLQSGYAFQWNLQTSTNGAAVEVPLNATDNVAISDTMAQASDVMRNLTTNWAIDERMITANTGPAQIYSMVKKDRAAAWGDLVKLVENRIWDCPLSTETNRFRGLLYYIVKDTAVAAGQFTDDLPVNRAQTASGFTTIAGIDPAVTTQWRNWAGAYTTISKTDLVRKMRSAARNTDFMCPIDVPQYGEGSDYGIYTNYDVLSVFEELLEAQNQNLGNDIASKDGRVMFKRFPVIDVPQLDEHTKDPVIGVNWSVMDFVVLEGEYFREMMDRSGLQHRTIRHFVDLTMGLRCHDRRRQWILQTT